MKSGVYLIVCTANGQKYVGSSKNITKRWYQHRTSLRRQRHTCRYLQHCWSKYGEDAFEFSVLEHCADADLLVREQHFIDLLSPALNVMTIVERWTPSEEMKQRVVEKIRERAAKRTHCPHGHEYTPENTYYVAGKPRDKRCRACAYEHNRKTIESETPEQREQRLARMRAYYRDNHAECRAKRNEYSAKTREAKRAYDRMYRPIKNARRRERAAMNRSAGTLPLNLGVSP